MGRNARGGQRLPVWTASRQRLQPAVATLLAVAWGRLWGGRIRFEPWVNLIVCEHMRGGYARGGTCVGGVYLTGGTATRRVLLHESVHAEQWALHGLSFVVRYLLEERRHPGAANRFEIEAGLADGGYRV